MTEEKEIHDNDSDKRPRMYARGANEDSEFELTVQGGEGETVEDIEDSFEEQLDNVSEKADSGGGSGTDGRGFE